MNLLTCVLALHNLWLQKWPFPRGKWIFRRFLHLLAHAHAVKPAWRETPHHFRLWLDPQDHLQREILLTGCWEAKETDVAMSTLSPGDDAIDIGANIGYFTLVMARAVGPSGRVLACEPNPVVMERLRCHIEANHVDNVIQSEVACSDASGRSTLFVNGPHNSGKSSLCASNVAVAGKAMSVSVACTRADELVSRHHLSNVRLVKIDVEGAELSVLQGLTTLLRVCRPLLLVELEHPLLAAFNTSAEEIYVFLRGFGYSGQRIPGSANHLFTAG